MDSVYESGVDTVRSQSEFAVWRSVTLRRRGDLTKEQATGMWSGMLIYKIFRADEFATLLQDGETLGAPVDLADGYVHLSTGDQTGGTLAKHFAGETGLTLLAVEADDLGDDLKWEVSRGDALFPHLYRALRIEDVTWHKPLVPADMPSGFVPIWL